MACPKYEEQLTEAALVLIPGSLEIWSADTSVDGDLQRHLQGCASCRAALNGRRALLARIDSGVAAMVSAEPPAALISRVRQQIAAVQVSHGARWWQWAGAGIGLAAAAALALFLLARPGVRTPRPSRADQASNAPSAPLGIPRNDQQQRATAAVGAAASPPRTRPAVEKRHGAADDRATLHNANLSETRAPEFEVIVPPGQREAVVHFAEALRMRSIDEPQLVTSSKDDGAGPLPLELKPLKIQLLDGTEEVAGDGAKANGRMK
jgi:hypothetical protein